MKTNRSIAFVALFAAILCVLSPFSIPIGPVSITLATLGVYLISALLDVKKAPLVVIIYIIIGCIGIPVFSNFRGGIDVIAGPTGGYIVGYVLCALAESLMITPLKKHIWIYPLSMVVGTVFIYAFGTAWFLVAMNGQYTLATAMSVCVYPFLAFDAIKIVLASILTYRLRKIVDGYLEVDDKKRNNDEAEKDASDAGTEN